MKSRATRGFTLIELMMVVLIIGILVGILLPALFGAKKSAKRRQIQAASSALVTAIRTYDYQYGNWPCPVGDLNSTSDRVYTADNYRIIEILRSAVPPLIDMGSFQTNSQGSVVDPWQEPYAITIDTDCTDDHPDMPNGVKVLSLNTNVWR